MHARISIAARGASQRLGHVALEQQLEPAVTAPVAHPGRAALADRDQPGLLQPLERLAHAVPAGVERLAQPPLGRQRLADGVAAAEDVGAQLRRGSGSRPYWLDQSSPLVVPVAVEFVKRVTRRTGRRRSPTARERRLSQPLVVQLDARLRERSSTGSAPLDARGGPQTIGGGASSARTAPLGPISVRMSLGGAAQPVQPSITSRSPSGSRKHTWHQLVTLERVRVSARPGHGSSRRRRRARSPSATTRRSICSSARIS